jgi:hypothetical protein
MISSDKKYLDMFLQSASGIVVVVVVVVIVFIVLIFVIIFNYCYNKAVIIVLLKK